uniref:Uncharacterized protein n=1 Tax=Arundo donax TaxID=35708 RepID=A0A0A9BTA4_ARUDO
MHLCPMNVVIVLMPLSANAIFSLELCTYYCSLFVSAHPIRYSEFEPKFI